MRGRQKPVKEIKLEMEREHRQGLTLMRPAEPVSITLEQRFAVLPADKGHGWVLRIYDAAPDNAS